MSTKIQTLGVVGAGQMGRGIAQTAAQAGVQVLLGDASLAQASAAREQIVKGLDKLVEKGKLDAAARAATVERIRAVASLAELAPCQLVVEAVSESEELKRRIFGELDAVLAPTAILASNTSSISITRLGAGTKRAAQFIGMHFMNPVPVMKLVEVIRGAATSDETYASVVALAESMGKTVVTSSDYPGFIVNRVLMPMINEAAYALMEGVASREDIDNAMKLGTNQPMGPLTLADFIGLDTCVAILGVLHDGTGDPKYRACPLMRRYVEAGWVGKKAGRGFYTYA